MSICHLVATAQAVWVVNTSDDVYDGICNATHCSLREAIEAANTNNGPDSIVFNIPGPGPHVISPGPAALPGIIDSFLSINGTSQPGNFPMAGQIIIDGAMLTAMADHGLVINTRHTRIQGLCIRNFPGDGIQLFGGFVDDNYLSDITIGGVDKGNIITGNDGYGLEGPVNNRIRIQGNYIGTNLQYNAGLGNALDGLFLDVLDGDNVIIGGVAGSGRENVIGSNGFSGIKINLNNAAPEYDDFYLIGNYVGTDPSRTEMLGNLGFVFGGGQEGGGIIVIGDGDLAIGGSGDSINVIAYNYDGIFHRDFAGKTFHDNLFICNSNGGIRLEGGANNDITAPYNLCVGETTIWGMSDPNVRVDVYIHDDATCAGAPCQGASRLGTTQSDGSGAWTLNAAIPGGGSVTAIATDATGSSSEFADCLLVLDVEASNTGPYCPGDSIFLQATTTGTPSTIQWQGPNGYTSDELNPVDAVDSGLYMIVVDFGGCVFDTSETRVEFLPVTSDTLRVICGDEMFVVNGTVYDKDNLSGVEVLEGANAYGCDSIVVINLVPFPTPQGGLFVPEYACAGDTIDVSFLFQNPSGPYDVVYSNGVDPPDTLEGITSGYTFPQVVTGDMFFRLIEMKHAFIQCASTLIKARDTVLVSSIAVDADVSTYGDYNLSCHESDDGSISLNVTGSEGMVNYAWNNITLSGSDVSDLPAGDYSVTVTDVAGCSAVLDTTLTEPERLAPVIEVARPSCQGAADGSFTIDTILGGRGAIEWSPDNINFIPITSYPVLATDLAAGERDIYFRDDSACISETTVVIPDGDAAFVDAGPTLSIAAGDSTTLSFSSDLDDFDVQWSPAALVECPTCPTTKTAPQQSTFFNVRLTNEAGCVAVDSVLVQVFVPKRVYIPNVFSPNGDGVNDYFWIYANDFAMDVEYVVIADRGGTVVYSDEDLSLSDQMSGWDGTFDGEPLNPGVFTYLIRIRFSDGKVVPYSGTVTLVR